MDGLLLVARLVLAGIFATAGVAKLADLPGTRKAMAGFGVPARLIAASAFTLPIVELVLAFILIPRTSAWWGALGALLLLVGFIGVIVHTLKQGRQLDCHCFGKLGSEPTGTLTVVRDGLFAVPAAFVVLFGWGDPGSSATAWFRDLNSWERVLTILAVLLVAAATAQIWLALQMLGQNQRSLARLDAIEAGRERATMTPTSRGAGEATELPLGLLEGTAAPSFQIDGLFGESQTLAALRAGGKPVLLLFTDPKCGPCNALLPDVGRWERQHAGRLTVAVVTRGDREANRAKATEYGLSTVLLDANGDVSGTYQATGTPSAVLVRANGTIGGPVVRGAEAIRLLVADFDRLPVPASKLAPAGRTMAQALVESGAIARNGSHVDFPLTAPVKDEPIGSRGTPSPSIALPDLNGNEVNLNDFLGEPTLVLFWNPSCGFCRRMVRELKAWETAPPMGAPQLLVVSTGTVDANLDLGLLSTVVLDQSFATGTSFGVRVTPSAVLIDADGFLASGVGAGARGVMALANGDDPDSVANGRSNATPVGAKQGEPAPPVRLNDLDGDSFELAQYAGHPVSLLFWSPHCPYCRRIQHLLRELEASRPDDAPAIVVVSRGGVDENRALDLRSRIVLDDDFEFGRKLGAIGTPSAVLIDANGKIASDVATGGSYALDLIGFDQGACERCLDDCRQRGGGDACLVTCRIGDKCP